MIRLLHIPCVLAGMLVWAFAGAQEPSHKTDWFHNARYGVFVHYLNGLQNTAEQPHSLGKQTSWDACVHEFDTERFARQIAETGAGYVIFTMQQRTRFLIAPNATFDRITGYKPGEACSTRDLVEDLYHSLHKRGIALMLYWTGDGPRDDPKASRAMGYPGGDQINDAYVKAWADVVREYGERYKGKVRGWWCDGCYRSIGYDDAKLGVMADALRAGYPDRIVALNVGVEDRVHSYSRHEDFTTGEQNAFKDVPDGRFVNSEQWHLLSFLGDNWASPGLRLGKQALVDYVANVNARGGVISIDVMLFRDGGLDRSQLEVLKALKQGLKRRASYMGAR